MNKRTWGGALVALGLVCAGCSSSNHSAMDAGPDGGGGAAGQDAGKPDASMATDSGTTMTAMPVPCGSNMCQPPAGLGALAGGLGGAAGGLGGLGGALPMPVACCLDDSAGTCGLAPMAGATCEKPAVPDDRCPGPDLGALGALAGGMMAGCCTDDGMCGVDGATFGNGCVENSAAASMIMAVPLIGSFIMIPPPRPCDATGEDGGTMMMSGGDVDAGN